ncbi:eCIS core domain-containing protein [Flavobacterium gelatinilyticum]|uniref:eCIS core domain-containing protein n=1 Tax=Flavobacterium gelatinilyticum TaxID=3003260 RepID=UPI002480186B|nr:DUF4157 domain-containing protein [Flavobacterium gelatinilyticum]
MRAFEQRKKDIPGNSSFFSSKVQKKLKTGSAGDKYEIEADKTADKVVNNTASKGLLQSKADEEVQQKPISETISTVQSKEMKEEEPVQKKEKEEEKPVQKKSAKEEEKPVQKKGKEEEKPVQAKCEDCQKEEKVQKKDQKEEEKPVQKKAQNQNTEIQNNDLEGKLDSSKGGGNGLDKKTKNEMESGFGTDFSNVKIHTDSSAVQMSQELGAQAFTNGSDVYFNEGKYNPDSKEGKHLLAHELTHTIQQTGMVQKSTEQNLVSEDLEAARFKGDYRLEQTHDRLDRLSTGSKGGSVQKVQSGLLDLGYDLPKFGADGDFGSETKAAILDFQSQNDLTYDGIVGGQTIGRLDDLFIGKGKGNKKKKTPPKIVCDKTTEFNFSSDPVAYHDFKATDECKTFAITLTTTKNKKANPCPAYLVEITNSDGKTVRPEEPVAVGSTHLFNFTAPTKGSYTIFCKTIYSCGANAFKGTGKVIRITP